MPRVAGHPFLHPWLRASKTLQRNVFTPNAHIDISRLTVYRGRKRAGTSTACPLPLSAVRIAQYDETIVLIDYWSHAISI